MLIDKAVEVNIEDKTGRTPVDYAKIAMSEVPTDAGRRMIELLGKHGGRCGRGVAPALRGILDRLADGKMIRWKDGSEFSAQIAKPSGDGDIILESKGKDRGIRYMAPVGPGKPGLPLGPIAIDDWGELSDGPWHLAKARTGRIFLGRENPVELELTEVLLVGEDRQGVTHDALRVGFPWPEDLRGGASQSPSDPASASP